MKRSRVFGLLVALAVSLWAAGSLRAATAPGDMVWEQTFKFTGYDTIVIGAVAASTTTLIVCGTAYNLASDTGDIGFIKAFDQATGTPKWQLDPPLSTGTNRNSFNSLAVVGNMVVVEGYSSSYTKDPNIPYPTPNLIYTLNQSSLWAYIADTGALFWGPVAKDPAAPTNLGPTNMVAANNKVFVVRNEKGYHDSSGTTGNCIVEAYQVGAASLAPMSLLLQ